MNKNTPLPEPTSAGAEILYKGIQIIDTELDRLNAQSKQARAAYGLINNGSAQGTVQGDPEPQPTAIKSGTRTRTGKRKPMSEAAKKSLSVKAKARYAAQRAEHNTQGGKAGKRGTRVMTAAG